jgi:hypothetical protein
MVKPVDIGIMDDMKASLAALKRNLPEQLEFMVVKATLTRTYFNALVKEGFTDEEALELCKEAL